VKAAKAKGVSGAIRHQFTDSLNAFTIELTQKQAAALATLPQVEFVQRAGVRPLLTDRGPQFIGADQVWSGSTYTGVDYMGEGIIVGELDTGINTDHPSFAATGGDGFTVTIRSQQLLGDCAGNNPAVICNATYAELAGRHRHYNGAPPSGEDYNGHGATPPAPLPATSNTNVPYYVRRRAPA
jgi:hypothetical protein